MTLSVFDYSVQIGIGTEQTMDYQLWAMDSLGKMVTNLNVMGLCINKYKVMYVKDCIMREGHILLLGVAPDGVLLSPDRP